jgi:metallo-beta-lactamase family protein
MTLTLTSLGGAGTVTGSRHLLEFGGNKVLIDCGMFQGNKELRERNWSPFPVDPKSIDAVILTHAHIDHSGYLPKLVREGFEGPVYCSSATADLCEILLRDSAYIAEKDAEYARRKKYSKHKHPLPIYTIDDAEIALKQLRPVAFDADIDLPGGAVLRMRRAGHILGAATLEIRVDGKTVVFSGDLGRYDDPFMFDPVAVPEADYLIVESTYGDRTHPKINPMEALGETIERTVERGGTVVIPSFAVGRAQLIMYHIWMLKQLGRISTVPIFLDSPMAINAQGLLCNHMEDHRFDDKSCAGSCAVATYTREVSESKAITTSPMPKVIISASGMATAGRVLHHIKSYGPNEKNTILFAGYQAQGTRGAKLLEGADRLRMFGKDIQIRAEIAKLPALSAHADCDEILRWLTGFQKPPKRTFIVHGELSASEALGLKVNQELGWDCTVAEPEKSYELA